MNKKNIIYLGFIFMLAFSASYFLDFSKKIEQVKDNHKQIVDLTRQLNELYYQQAILEEDISQMPVLKNMVSEWRGKMVKSTDLPKMLREIEKIGRGAQLRIAMFSPRMPVKAGQYEKVPLMITVVGTYYQTADFVNQIVALPWMVTIEDFTLQNIQENNALTAELVLGVYYQ